ncbi:hypothetical protein EVAR_69778_1 [Eumeta japonica]|uniref:Uncharacterized protein n=1 Tax=Eumeta variegata TaxID=151549 RepID=A0A4C2AAJ3_EUMVA|nr:hypothetical protein EVAR_69778_1 [Eumeta japonica]
MGKKQHNHALSHARPRHPPRNECGRRRPAQLIISLSSAAAFWPIHVGAPGAICTGRRTHRHRVSPPAVAEKNTKSTPLSVRSPPPPPAASRSTSLAFSFFNRVEFPLVVFGKHTQNDAQRLFSNLDCFVLRFQRRIVRSAGCILRVIMHRELLHKKLLNPVSSKVPIVKNVMNHDVAILFCSVVANPLELRVSMDFGNELLSGHRWLDDCASIALSINLCIHGTPVTNNLPASRLLTHAEEAVNFCLTIYGSTRIRTYLENRILLYLNLSRV